MPIDLSKGEQSEIARWMNVSRQAVWCVCHAKGRIRAIEDVIAKRFGKTREDMFGPNKKAGRPRKESTNV